MRHRRSTLGSAGWVVAAPCAVSACSGGASQTRGRSAALLDDRAISGGTAAAIPGQGSHTLPRDSIADLSRSAVDTRLGGPSGREIRVSAGGNLQAALNRAVAGDVVLLSPEAVYEGNYTL